MPGTTVRGPLSIRTAAGTKIQIADASGKVSTAQLPVYANNAAAVAGGLAAGALYRTGADPDPVCVVH